MQLGHELRLAPLQLGPEELREQVVEAVPAAVVVEREQEEVRARERVQRRRGALGVQDGVAERRAEPLEHRGAQHERLQLRRVGGQDLGGEEVDDVGARAVERGHQRVPVPGRRQRERGEVDARRPALGAGDEQIDVGGREPEAEPAVEELGRLGAA